MNNLKCMGIFIFGLLVGAWSIKMEFIGNPLGDAAVKISFAELASIALTAATVVLAGVALAIGIAAVVGFKMIRDESVEQATKKAGEKVDGSLREELQVVVQQQLPGIIKQGIRDGELSSVIVKAYEKSIIEAKYNDELKGDNQKGYDPNR